MLPNPPKTEAERVALAEAILEKSGYRRWPARTLAECIIQADKHGGWDPRELWARDPEETTELDIELVAGWPWTRRRPATPT